MSAVALALVLTAAVAHASWNFLAKTATGGARLIWLIGLTSGLLMTPFALVILVADGGGPGWEALGFMAVSGLLHSAYFVLLQRGYATGDLSFVYPLARGFGPLLATIAAIALLGERPSAVALAGSAVIVVAVLSLAAWPSGESAGAPGVREATSYALATGVFIACYTLWDKQAVGSLDLDPVVYYWGSTWCIAAVLSPVALGAGSGGLGEVWRANRRAVLGVAALSSAAYVLVLYALAIAPVTLVAPAREASILVGAALGTQLLQEGDTRRRLTCAAAIVVGIGLLAAG